VVAGEEIAEVMAAMEKIFSDRLEDMALVRCQNCCKTMYHHQAGLPLVSFTNMVRSHESINRNGI
jgi:hypothetical protein